MNKKELLKPSGKTFLLGDEAVVRGALEAGVQVTVGFPGSPAAEIGDTFYAIAHEVGVYNEYSTNEKVAYETAIGASLAGAKALVSFKHFGLNVASDSVLPSAYIEPEASLVCVAIDDPQGISSIQSEQDTRYYARMSNIPMLEPSNQQEAKDFTKLAFQLSEKYKTPVFLRFTTRVAHGSSEVTLEKFSKSTKKLPGFIKDKEKFNTFSPKLVEIHEKILVKLNKIQAEFDKLKINRLINKNSGGIGLITTGISLDYVQEALVKLKIRLPILHIGSTYPLPQGKIKNFIKNKKKILVFEELEPILENEIKNIAQDNNIKVNILGKDYLPRVGEYRPEMVTSAVANFLGKKFIPESEKNKVKVESIKPLRRFPVMCAGCPHRSTYYSVKQATQDAIFGGDIGCVMLGYFPPHEIQDFMYDMGAVMGITNGIAKAHEYFGSAQAKKKKVIAFIGDGTFFHAGMPGLVNAVYNNSDILFIILDNSITAMTGHQLNAGMGKNGMGEKSNEIKILNVARAMGVDNCIELNPYQQKVFTKQVQSYLEIKGPKVIVAKQQCALLAYSERKKKGIKLSPFTINQDKCLQCGKCLNEFACPAMYKKNGKYHIDPKLCVSCGACLQVCPHGAIEVSKNNEK